MYSYTVVTVEWGLLAPSY